MFEAIVNHLDAADKAVLKARTIAAAAEGLPVDATRELIHALVRDAHREIIAVYKALGYERSPNNITKAVVDDKLKAAGLKTPFDDVPVLSATLLSRGRS